MLRVLGRYRSSKGSWEPGQEIQVLDELGEFLLRDSPGSFSLAGAAAMPPVAAPADDEDDEDFDPTGAMSTETASGLVVPDRRARGGRRRDQ